LVNNVFIAGIALALLVACERSDVPYGNVKQSPDSPSYAVGANDGDAQGTSIIQAVLPAGEEVLDGKALFAANCSACHQIHGNGVPGVFPPLNNSPYVVSDKVERMAAIVLYGLQGEIPVNGVTYNNVMAGLGGALNDKKIAAIMTYIRSAWDNKAGPVDPSVVTSVRQKYGTRAGFNINELGKES